MVKMEEIPPQEPNLLTPLIIYGFLVRFSDAAELPP
jgi:hypothetical protein